ncbi:receptor protein-tyrosine kinase [Kineococcus radiotolerans]|uniref:Lipopolysaccharide biosynthesis protein n=2 Tax=Kineococcus radiotolerans TaxID=131568 RepID=A6W917_KINRD|nr:LPS biosynthesis protein [Kineococcus radiotolerans]ABS03306.1 lipopolysaccharide biosynthesis protein [Kineococcus radiotolerans SRS30216 = ATCC BAA-149]MBB2899575.1 receptor protein-tyrosine kinase [Kineococcus radiotolerans]
MELIDHLRLAARRWTWILAGILLGGLAAGGWAYLTPRTYASSTELFVGSVLNGQNETGGGANSASQFVLSRMSTYAQLVDSPDIAASVEDRTGLGLTSAQFADSVSATVPPGTVLLRVTAQARTPERAQDLAGATADALATTIEALEQNTSGGGKIVDATVTSPATAPNRPASPDVPTGLGIGLAAGLALGVLAATARDQAVRRRSLALAERDSLDDPAHLLARR